MPPILIAMLLALGVAILGANLVATTRVVRSGYGSWGQQAAQVAFIWLLPVLGAAVLISLTRSNLQPGSCCYPKEKEEPEDVAVAHPDYSSSD